MKYQNLLYKLSSRFLGTCFSAITSAIRGEPATLRQSHLRGAPSDGIGSIKRVVAGDLLAQPVQPGFPSLGPLGSQPSPRTCNASIQPSISFPHSTPNRQNRKRSRLATTRKQKRQTFSMSTEYRYICRWLEFFAVAPARYTVFRRISGKSALRRRGGEEHEEVARQSSFPTLVVLIWHFLKMPSSRNNP